MMENSLSWKTRVRDDLVYENIINAIINTVASNMDLVKDYQSNHKWDLLKVYEFFGHLKGLRDLAGPHVSVKTTINFTIPQPWQKLLRESFKLYNELIPALKKAGIWDLTRYAKFKDLGPGKLTVMGL